MTRIKISHLGQTVINMTPVKEVRGASTEDNREHGTVPAMLRNTGRTKKPTTHHEKENANHPNRHHALRDVDHRSGTGR
ncbi:MAG: hypothetical protein JNN07_09275 [Verrucomicrobiales bacterium]|nr:hypothetical protein [Verrucomicrobiales bacterium]